MREGLTSSNKFRIGSPFRGTSYEQVVLVKKVTNISGYDRSPLRKADGKGLQY